MLPVNIGEWCRTSPHLALLRNADAILIESLEQYIHFGLMFKIIWLLFMVMQVNRH